jgi:hypothetical protein
VETGDQIRPEAFPILFATCAESIRRLARFDCEQWSGEDVRFPTNDIRHWSTAGPSPIATEGLDEHARALLAQVQFELARRPSPLSLNDAFELVSSRRVALQALMWLRDNRYAKAVQAEVARPGVPLTVCTGRGARDVIGPTGAASSLPPPGVPRDLPRRALRQG